MTLNQTVQAKLDTIRAHAPGADAVFMAGTWAECPAVAFVPALLRVVWERLAPEPSAQP